jgi:RNA recognition motif-containing protein
MKKLFIGNLPFQSTETDLMDWFTSHGFSPAEVAIVRHRLTGDSKGFGFAEFADEDDSRQALERLNGAEYQGRRLMLSVARSGAPTARGQADPATDQR